MKRELRKRHTKEGGSRRKRKRQTRKKQRGGFSTNTRHVKDDEWRIQRKYSRVKYVDGVEFDFEKYEGEGGGNKIIHVLGKEDEDGDWKKEEFAIQVFDIENDFSDKKLMKAMKQIYNPSENKKKNIMLIYPINLDWFKIFKSGKINIKDSKEILEEANKIINAILDRYKEWGNEKLMTKRDDNMRKDFYSLTLFIYYINVISKGKLTIEESLKDNIKWWWGTTERENPDSPDSPINTINDTNFHKKFNPDEDYRWLIHWVLNCRLFNGAPDPDAESRWVLEQQSNLLRILEEESELDSKSQKVLKTKINESLESIDKNTTKTKLDSIASANLMKLEKIKNKGFTYDVNYGVLMDGKAYTPGPVASGTAAASAAAPAPVVDAPAPNTLIGSLWFKDEASEIKEPQISTNELSDDEFNALKTDFVATEEGRNDLKSRIKTLGELLEKAKVAEGMMARKNKLKKEMKGVKSKTEITDEDIKKLYGEYLSLVIAFLRLKGDTHEINNNGYVVENEAPKKKSDEVPRTEGGYSKWEAIFAKYGLDIAEDTREWRPWGNAGDYVKCCQHRVRGKVSSSGKTQTFGKIVPYNLKGDERPYERPEKATEDNKWQTKEDWNKVLPKRNELLNFLEKKESDGGKLDPNPNILWYKNKLNPQSHGTTNTLKLLVKHPGNMTYRKDKNEQDRNDLYDKWVALGDNEDERWELAQKLGEIIVVGQNTNWRGARKEEYDNLMKKKIEIN